MYVFQPVNKKYISEYDYSKISTYDQGLERSVLALVKTHKPKIDGKYKKRIIINNSGSASDSLEKYLYNMLKVVENHIPTLLKSPNELLGRYMHFEIPDDFELISTDISDMYSSIDPTKSINCLIKFIKKQKVKLPVPIDNLHKLLEECIIKSCSFQVENNYYKQKRGLKTGSPLSGLLADVYIFVNYESNFVLKQKNIQGYCRYRDDTLMACRKSYKTDFLNSLNTMDKNI